MARLELATTCSQSRHTTNCTTSRFPAEGIVVETNALQHTHLSRMVPRPLGFTLLPYIESAVTNTFLPVITTRTLRLSGMILTGTIAPISFTSSQNSINYLVIWVKVPTFFSKYLNHINEGLNLVEEC